MSEAKTKPMCPSAQVAWQKLQEVQDAGKFSTMSDAEISWETDVGIGTVRNWRRRNQLPAVKHTNKFVITGGRSSLAYKYRAEDGMKWSDIDKLLTIVNSCAMAKEWAIKNNKPWPIK